MRSWTIRKNLFSVIAVIALATIAMSTMSNLGFRSAEKSLDQMLVATTALRDSMQADMMHDALRADVLAALVASEQADFAQAADDQKEHAETFLSSLDELAALALDGAILEKVNVAKTAAHRYADMSREIVQIAATDKTAALARRGEFLTLFSELEEMLGASGDRIENEAVSKQQLGVSTLGYWRRTNSVACVILVVVVFVAGLVLSSLISGPLQRVIEGLNSVSSRVGQGVENISSASRQLASSASVQASGLEETAAALEEIASMAKQSADNSKEAQRLTTEAQGVSENGVAAMLDMARAIQDIRQSAEETAGIVRIIDDIAFQTNLLALNAAVEAARAGDAGKGFAVVAEEVRALAQRSSHAAKDTSEKISKSRELADNGVKVSEDVKRFLEDIRGKVAASSALIKEIAAASGEQSCGIVEVNKSVTVLDTETQTNSKSSEHLAESSAQLLSQSEAMKQAIGELDRMVYARGGAKSAVREAAPLGKRISRKPAAKTASVKSAAPKAPTKPAQKPAHQPLRFEPPASSDTLKPNQIIPLDDADFQGF